jgi:hypothetical protein
MAMNARWILIAAVVVLGCNKMTGSTDGGDGGAGGAGATGGQGGAPGQAGAAGAGSGGSTGGSNTAGSGGTSGTGGGCGTCATDYVCVEDVCKPTCPRIITCTAAEVCVTPGFCQARCAAGDALCADGACVAPNGGDATHCGGCDPCPIGATCNAGICRPL